VGNCFYSIANINAAIPPAAATSMAPTLNPFAPLSLISDVWVGDALASLDPAAEVPVTAATTTVVSVIVDGWPFVPITVLVSLEVYKVVPLEAVVVWGGCVVVVVDSVVLSAVVVEVVEVEVGVSEVVVVSLEVVGVVEVVLVVSGVVVVLVVVVVGGVVVEVGVVEVGVVEVEVVVGVVLVVVVVVGTEVVEVVKAVVAVVELFVDCRLASWTIADASAARSRWTASRAVRSPGNIPCLYFPSYSCNAAWRDSSSTSLTKSKKSC
jgi:hypothetical protein